MSLQATPVRLDLKKDEKLVIEWQDGVRSEFPIAVLRRYCPCAMCKNEREEEKTRPKTKLRVLGEAKSGGPLAVVHAELVGGYALRLEWTDDHSSGIYSFQYLRELAGRLGESGG